MRVADINPLSTDALIVARVVDAASLAPRSVRSVTTSAKHAYVHVATGGYLVVSGRPELVLPNLAITGCDIDAQLRFDDRPPLDLTFAIPAGSSLPFRPGDVEVELPPVALTGTITAAAFPNAPIQAATITVAAPPATPPPLLALRTPFAVEHPDGALVRERTIAPAAAATSLSEAAVQGASAVTVLNTAGFLAGGVAVLGDDSTAEHISITAVDGGLRRVTLGVPLRRSRPAGAQARAFTATGAGPPTALARAAVAGDGVLQVTPAFTAALVEVGGPTSELRATDAIADSGGRWRLDGVRAIGQLQLTIGAAGYVTSMPLAYDVDYRHPNLIDLQLSV